MLHDAELLRRYMGGSGQAFAELVRRHIDLVHSAALRRLGGDAHAAADVAQQVFVRLALQANAVAEQDGPLASWLYAVTRNVAVDYVRSERSRRRREEEAHAMNELHAGNAEPQWERIRPVLDAAIDELEPEDREAVVLRFFAQLSFSRIGAALDLTEDGARMRVSRAVDKLYVFLAKRGITSTAAALTAVLAGNAVAATPPGLSTTISSAATAAALKAGVGSASMSLMSAKQIGSAIAVVAVIASLGFGGFALHQRRVAEAALAVERRDVAELARRVIENRQRAVEVKTAVARGTSGDGAAVVKKPALEEEMRGPFGPEPPGSRARGRALMAAHPEIERLLVAEKRAYFAERYRKFYDEAGLTPDQIEAFERVKIAGISSSYGGVNPEQTVTLTIPAISDDEKERRIREILGDRSYPRLQEYERSPRDTRVGMLAAALYYSDSPLSGEQATQLQRVLADSGRWVEKNAPPTAYWNTVREKAATFLSDAQITSLGRLQAIDEFTYARMENQKLREGGGSSGAK